jgi:hypothetical protein
MAKKSKAKAKSKSKAGKVTAPPLQARAIAPFAPAPEPAPAVPPKGPIEAGVYSIKGGGYRAAITTKKGVKDLGLHKTHEEAKAVYQKAHREMYPVPPTNFPPGTKHVGLEAAPLVVKRPKMDFN